jgi:competence protein ComEC
MGYKELNNYSIVIKLQYGKTSFLFTGDAEGLSEKEMMRRGFDLSANVLKLGHHGSIRSTTNEFLDRVNPKYAVIMVGKNNNYRHPHKRTMEKLKAKGIKVYRTDENGTITAASDGENITFDKNPGSYKYKN